MVITTHPQSAQLLILIMDVAQTMTILTRTECRTMAEVTLMDIMELHQVAVAMVSLLRQLVVLSRTTVVTMVRGYYV